MADNKTEYAPVAELADALDLGSSVPDVKVQVLSGAPAYRYSYLYNNCTFSLCKKSLVGIRF